MAGQDGHSAIYIEQGTTKMVISSSGILINDGVISSTGTINNNGILNNNGTISSSGAILNRGILTNSGEISGAGDIKTEGLLEVSTGGALVDAAGKWDDMTAPLVSAKAGPLNPPDFDIFLTGTGSTLGVRAFLFDSGTNESLFFDLIVPHSWKVGSEIQPHIHWSPTTTGSGVVRWGLEYTISDANGVFPNPIIIYSTDSVSGDQKSEALIAGFDPDIDMSSIAGPAAMLICRVFRDAASTKDTYAGDAAGHELDFHYQIGKLGTFTIFGT